MNSMIVWLDNVFGKFPALPEGFRNFLRQALPWIFAIGSALTLLAFLAALGVVGTAFMLFPWTIYTSGLLSSINFYVITPLAALLGLLGGIGMIRGRIKGWELAIYTELLYLLSAVLMLSLSGILFNLVGLWFLFQIRSYFISEQGTA